jgi:hypothetical protein
MANGSFVSRIIQVNLTLASGQFGADLGNTKVVSGLRVSCDIKKSGTPAKNEAKIRIYGMLDSDMNKLSTLGVNPMVVRKNFIQVLAGDSDGLATAFQGEITGAWVNYHTPPDLNFEIHAIEGFYASVAPTAPISMPDGVPVATIFSSLAKQMGYAFQNNGVQSVIQNPYIIGSAYDQARSLAQMVNIEFGIDDGVLFIAPRGQARPPKGQVPLLSPSTGMKEYPIWDKQGLVVEALWDPAFQLNGLVVVAESAVERANGTWRIHGLETRIASSHPSQASWGTTLHLTKVGA